MTILGESGKRENARTAGDGSSLVEAKLGSSRRAMIPRYSRPEMAAIWDPQTRFRIWFEIEA
jgi:hypothetical protein